MSMEEMERQHIEKALNATRWRVSGPNGAANLLGLTRSVLRHRMQKLGIMATPAAHKRENLTHSGQED